MTELRGNRNFVRGKHIQVQGDNNRICGDDVTVKGGVGNVVIGRRVTSAAADVIIKEPPAGQKRVEEYSCEDEDFKSLV